MPDKKFTDFTLSTLTTGDFAVGYKANGSEEWRAPIKNILNLQVFPSVTGVFGRSGNILSASGDYSAEHITNDSLVSAPTVKDALNVLKQSIFDTGAATVNSVNSVFGRQGTVVGQSGDYKDTGVTNTSSVAGGTVKDALETLKTTIAATGAATLNSVNSVFGRQGSVVANSGDYSGEYITNTSDVIGGTVTNALNTLNTRLGSTGNVLFNRDADISGYLYNLQTGFQADINSRLEQTGQSIETNDVDSVFGRIGVVVGQSGDYSDTGITNTSTVVAPTVKDALSLLDSRLGSTGSDLFNRDNSISGALNHYITGLEARIEQTGSATVNTVTSVFGRQGVVVGQSGDYRDTGITNTSLVVAPTVKDALSTLHTRLEATGALASAPVTSVFGRIGAVVGQTGDYQDTGITNTSTVVGDTVKGALNTLNTRLGSTGALIPFDAVKTGDSSVLNNAWVIDEDNLSSNLDTKVPTQQSVKAYVDSASPILVRTGDANVMNYRWVLDEDDFVSNSNTKLPTQQSVKAYADAIAANLGSTGSFLFNRDNSISGALNHYITGLEARIESTGSATANTVTSVFGRQGVVAGQSGDYKDSGVTNTSNVVGGTVKDAFNTLNTRLEATGALASAPVTSVFGRIGVVVGQSGDYVDSGVTNTSLVTAPTVKDALSTLHTRLEATGALASAPVTSVFGRVGVVVGQSGDYRDSGITNTSIVDGGTVKDAFATLHTRLEATGALAAAPVSSVFGRVGVVVGQTGDYRDTGITNTSTVTGGTVKDAFDSLNIRLGETGALGVTSFKEGGLNYYYSGSVTGLKGFFFMPYTVDLIDYKMIGDVTGDVTVGLRTGRYDLWEGPDTLVSFCNNSSPRMVNQRKNTSGEFSTSWATGRIYSGDILGIYIEQMTGTNIFDMNLNWKRVYS